MHTQEALSQYLQWQIFPRLASPPYGAIETSLICQQRPVYLYHESVKQVKVVGKPNQYGDASLHQAWTKTEREFGNLKLLRDAYGMRDDNYTVVEPLGKHHDFAALLVVTFANGRTLDHYIERATSQQKYAKLFEKLGKLARFLNKLHSNGWGDRPVSLELPQWYLSKLLETLSQDLLSREEKESLLARASGWWNRSELTADHQVIVHGDAHPLNFLFDRDQVTGIDLEKMKWADRCWDLGFMAAELKHHFIWRTGKGRDAEPFIGHFLWEYAFRDPDFFHKTTRRLPLYMALGLLRIARNKWLSRDYRLNLVGEAKLCLEYKP